MTEQQIQPDFSSVISSFAMYENSKPEQSTLIRQRDYRMHITVSTHEIREIRVHVAVRYIE